MAIEQVRNYFKNFNREQDILEFETSSATVELAALAVGTEPEKIAKTLSFKLKSGDPILIVVAGDAKVHNSKYKKEFGCKAKMLSPDEVVDMIGHAIGGVCPFAVKENCKIFLDDSLKRFENIYPACGSSNSAIKLSCSELEQYTTFEKWVSVCKGWQEESE